jgi:hypothetical protein
MKKKKDILYLDLFAKAFTIASLYLFGSATGAYNMCLTFIINIICYHKTKNEWKLSLLYWIFELILIIIFVNTYIGISSILVFITSSLTLMSNWWFSPQQMRLTAVLGSMLYLSYQISINNWAGLLEIIALGSNWLSYVKYKNTRRVTN